MSTVETSETIEPEACRDPVGRPSQVGGCSPSSGALQDSGSGASPRGFSLGIADVYVGLAALAVLVARIVPFSLVDGMAPCTFRVITSLPCPGCGFTRSFFRAAELDFAGAWLVSPLGTLLFLGLVVVTVLGGLRILLRRPWPRVILGRRARTLLASLIALVVVSNWAYLLVRHLLLGDWG